MIGRNRTPDPDAVLQSPRDVGVDMLEEDESVPFDSIVKPAAPLFGDACTAAHMEKLWALPCQAPPRKKARIIGNEIWPSETSKETKVALNIKRSGSSLEVHDYIDDSSVESQSPATTAQSSPPEQRSPTNATRKGVDHEEVETSLSETKPSGEYVADGNSTRWDFRALLRQLSGHSTTSGQVMPKTKKNMRTVVQDPEEKSVEALSQVNPNGRNTSMLIPRSEQMVVHNDDESPSSMAPAVTVKREQGERDEEEACVPSTTAVGVEEPNRLCKAQCPRIPTADVPSPDYATMGALRVSTLVEAAAEQGLVLACPPRDEEKVLYYSTRRAAVLALGFIAFLVVLAGMTLFTISSPIFYWFGVSTVFVVVYMCCHYLGMSVWGKDFNPETHAEIVRQGEEAEYFPTVDIYLPVCNEPLVLLANTWNYVLALDYPRATVHVLDDGAKDEVRDLAAEHGFNLPYLLDTSIGIVQTPQFFRRRNEHTRIEQGAGASQEFFYRMVQVNLDRFHSAVCVGSCGLYRRVAVEPFGGVAPIEHSEDMYTGFKMTGLGYKIKYVPLNLAMGVCPVEPRSLFMQQYRWCMGTLSLVTEAEFWTSNTSNIHKLAFLNGLLYYAASALFVFLGPTQFLLLVWLRGEWVMWYYTAFAVPSIIFSAIIIPLWSKQDTVRRGMAVHRVKVIQCYSHMFAIRDRIMGTVAPWVPSGTEASRSSSKAYSSSVRLLVVWNILNTTLIIGGAIWRMTAFPWYHFIAAVILALVACSVSLSTLVY